MLDLKERFRAIDHVPVPDLTRTIERRSRHLSVVPGALGADPGERRRRRVAPVRQLLAAAAIVILAIGLAVIAQHARGNAPVKHAPSPTPVPGAAGPNLMPTLTMTSSSFGWAAIPGEQEQIIRTADGGKHWVDVTPRQAIHPWGAQPVFLDDRNAWLLTLPAETVAGPSSDPDITDWGGIEIWHTEDGGHSWARLASFQPVPWFSGRKLPTLSFVDRQHGWIYVPFSAQGGQGSALYRTSDGGVHWSEISVSPNFPGHSTAESIPGDCLGAMSFTSASDGWLTPGCSTTDRFFTTRDGGITWKELPVPDKFIPFNGSEWHWGGPISKSSRGNLLFTVIGPGTGESAVYELYLSEDGGSTWTERPLPAGAFAPGLMGSVSIQPSFAGIDGWIVIDSALYTTDDGGRSWHKVGAPLGGVKDPWKLQVIDAGTAWILAGGVNGARSELLKSSNHGQTWTPQWTSQ